MSLSDMALGFGGAGGLLLSKLGSGGGTPTGVPNYFAGPSDPNVIAMQKKLNSMQMPEEIAPPDKVQGYQAKDMSKAALPQYDLARQQTTEALNAQEGSQRDAMNRKFAALGGGPGGASIKAGMQADQAAAENRASAMNQIGQQEAQTRLALQQQEAQKEFESGEQAKMYNAQAATHNKEFNADLLSKNNQFVFDANSKIAALDLGYKSAQQQAADDQFNAEMSAYQAKHSGGLLGAGGILGTGIGV